MKNKQKNVIEETPVPETAPSESPMKLVMWILGLPLGIIILFMTIETLL